MKFLNECWAFVPARSGSKSIKDKNIKLLNKALISYSLEQQRLRFLKK